MRPKDKAPVAEIFKLNGYATAQLGKCHEVPVWETSPVGPFDRWPSPGGGFEYFYGFIGGEANQWYPSLFEGTVPIEPDKTPEEGYHLVDDMTTKAIRWIRQQKALTPDQPFFMYFAPGATHAPHHVPDRLDREEQGPLRSGLGHDARRDLRAAKGAWRHSRRTRSLTPRPPQIPAWDDMPEELKPVLIREMEVYSAFMEYTDEHVGRLFGALDDLGITDDTLIYYIIGDNGASAEGTINGCFNEMANFNGHGRDRNARVPDQQAGRIRWPGVVQPLCRRLGACLEHAVSVDQAGGLALGRHPQRRHRALAEWHQGQKTRSGRNSPM